MIHKESWEVPALFSVLQELGSVDEVEMYRVFNMGIGMVAVASREDAPSVLAGGSIQGSKPGRWVR